VLENFFISGKSKLILYSEFSQNPLLYTNIKELYSKSEGVHAGVFWDA